MQVDQQNLFEIIINGSIQSVLLFEQYHDYIKNKQLLDKANDIAELKLKEDFRKNNIVSDSLMSLYLKNELLY